MDNNLREVNDDLMKEWFQFREETKLCNLTEEDKTEILSHASALFAGGKLSEDEQLAFINELQTLYLDAKKRLKDKETN